MCWLSVCFCDVYLQISFRYSHDAPEMRSTVRPPLIELGWILLCKVTAKDIFRQEHATLWSGFWAFTLVISNSVHWQKTLSCLSQRSMWPLRRVFPWILARIQIRKNWLSTQHWSRKLCACTLHTSESNNLKHIFSSCNWHGHFTAHVVADSHKKFWTQTRVLPTVCLNWNSACRKHVKPS